MLTGGGDCPGLNAVIRAVVRAAVRRGSQVTGFLETFPRLVPAWKPTTEARRRIELCAGDITLHGRFDLTLG